MTSIYHLSGRVVKFILNVISLLVEGRSMIEVDREKKLITDQPITKVIEEKAYAYGSYAIAYALMRISDRLDELGFNGANTPMGAMEGKARSIQFAMRMFPSAEITPKGSRKPRDGRSDALCLAYYGVTP
jgi:hypothetical protein